MKEAIAQFIAVLHGRALCGSPFLSATYQHTISNGTLQTETTTKPLQTAAAPALPGTSAHTATRMLLYTFLPCCSHLLH